MLKNITKLFEQAVRRGDFRLVSRLFVVIMLVLTAFVGRIFWDDLPERIAGRAEARDGDSLVVGRRRLRLEGIDAPERDQTCRRGAQSWQCGRDARKHLVRLIGDRAVDCTISKRDRFDRLLAHCRAGARDINRSMVRDGMAVSFGRRYRADEAAARREKLGLWASEFQRPQDWRRTNRR